MDLPRFEVFVNKMNILSSSLSRQTCFKIFDRVGQGHDLSRSQFLQAIVQIIFAKYLRPKAKNLIERMIKRASNSANKLKLPSDYIVSDLLSGIRQFFEILIPKFVQKRTWQEFRLIVQKKRTSQILIKEMAIIRRVYASWSEIVSNKRFFSISHALGLIELVREVTKKHPLGRVLVISDKDVSTCWGLSKITVKDMDRDFERTQHMVFVEFLEFLCRVAHTC